MSFAVVLVGGPAPEPRLVKGAEHADLIIAADGGLRIARTHGLPIHVVIGDLDSVSPGDLAWARAENAEIVEHPADKEQTDLELALDFADQAGVDRIVAIGIEGGRLDHELGNWAALSAPRSARVEVHTARGTASILHGGGHDRLDIVGVTGDLVSLIPRSDEATGVRTTGLRWPLDGATLTSATTRGISNELAQTEGSVELDHGTLMIIRPGLSALDS